jgi:hypothetical protein
MAGDTILSTEKSATQYLKARPPMVFDIVSK